MILNGDIVGEDCGCVCEKVWQKSWTINVTNGNFIC